MHTFESILAFKMASLSGTITDSIVIVEDVTDSTELLPLEHSSSAVWKHLGFPSKDGRIVENDKKNDGKFIARFVDVTIHMLAI